MMMIWSANLKVNRPKGIPNRIANTPNDQIEYTSKMLANRELTRTAMMSPKTISQ